MDGIQKEFRDAYACPHTFCLQVYDVQFTFLGIWNDDDSLYYENIKYVEASPYDSELVNLEVEKIVIPKDEEIEDDYTIAITPVLSTEEPVNSLSMGDEHLDTIPATESNELIKSSVEDLIPIPSEFEGIPDTMCDVHLVNNPTPLEAKDHFEILINSNDDISSSDDDSLYKENIEYVEASPRDSEVVSLEFLTKSSSTSPKSFLEETNTFHNSLPEFENFCFDLEEINSGSTTTDSDISLSNYEAFYFNDDHIKEISSGSTSTHSYVFVYDSFIFDPSND
nr:hypothetical protein [Tanacetum cinerariifolium]